jgi:hypothetical protein
MVDFNGDGNFDEIDAAILVEEESEKKQPAKNDNSGCGVMLFALCVFLPIIGWVIIM